MSETKIKCPNCAADIDINETLSSQLEKKYQIEFNNKLEEQKGLLKIQQDEIDKKKLAIEEERKKQDELIQQNVDLKLKEEKKKLESDIKINLEKEQSEMFDTMQKELKEKSDQLKEYNKTKADFEKLKREKDELKEQLEAENAKLLNEKLREETDKIKRAEEEKNLMKINELKKQLEDQKRLTEDMKRKQEQGSMQLQGEVQELLIEEWLRDKFIFDEIKEVPKGVNGADCIQIVRNNIGSECGIICYESKRTKSFSNDWIPKFKDDMSICKANIGILVTETYPKDMERMGLKDGVWICSFEEFKGLSLVLRENIIKLSEAVTSQENKGDKSIMLYNFLVSDEFRSEIEAIVEGFTQMNLDLIKEKTSIQAIWKKREKQIEKVILNTTNMYQSIKGIAGAAVKQIDVLELPQPENLIEE